MKSLRLFTVAATILLLFASPVLAASSTEAPEVVALESGFYYVVQEGDTLWDISRRFMDSEWAWPDIWAENQEITSNPHRIYPGQKIRLYKRDGSFSQSPESPEGLPGDFLASDGGVETVSGQPAKAPVIFRYSSIDQVGFISPTPISASGRVIGGLESKVMYTMGDQIYLKPEAGIHLPLGARYSIYQDGVEIRDPANHKKRIGYEYEISGLVEILSLKDGVTTARILKAYRPIRTGDRITAMKERETDIPKTEGPQSLQGRILKGSEDQVSMGQGDVVFVNFGTEAGGKPGQTFSLINTQTFSIGTGKDTEFRKEEIPFGEIILLDCQQTVSAGLILKSTDAVVVGTRIGQPR